MTNPEDNLANQLHGLVGEGEIEMRRILGNEKYEKLIRQIDEANDTQLARVRAETKLIENRAAFYSLVGAVLLIAMLWAIVASSIYLWA